MKRSGFKRRPGKKYKRLRSKPTEWDRWRPFLKLQFEAAGFTKCEIHLPGCWNKHFGFAHVDKRRWLVGLELYVGVVLACNYCHDIVEGWNRRRMRPFIQAIIDARGWMPSPPAEEATDAKAETQHKATEDRLAPRSRAYLDDLPF